MNKKELLSLGFIITIIIGIFFSFYNTSNDFFTFIVLPDTQKYTLDNSHIFNNQAEWIIKNKNSLNIKFVSHLGDIVQNGGLENNEWEIASKAMSLLDKANIPYSIIPGNHDIDEIGNPNSQFNKYNEVFPLDRFTNKPWFGGNLNKYQNNYQLIETDNIHFIILNLEVDPDNNILQWANEILSVYKDRKAIITTHVYLKDDTGEKSQIPNFRENGNSGEDIWNKIIINNCNVFLILSGHFHSDNGENQLTSINDCGQPVHQIVQNYQDRENGGNGLLRIYKFYPLTKEIHVSTYSTQTSKYEYDKNSHFILKWPI